MRPRTASVLSAWAADFGFANGTAASTLAHGGEILAKELRTTRKWMDAETLSIDSNEATEAHTMPTNEHEHRAAKSEARECTETSVVHL